MQNAKKLCRREKLGCREKLRALLGCRMQRSCVERSCREKLQFQRVATASCGPSRAGPVGGPRLYLGHFLPSVLRPTPPPPPPLLAPSRRPPPVMSSRDVVRQSVHENCCKRRDILRVWQFGTLFATHFEPRSHEGEHAGSLHGKVV